VYLNMLISQYIQRHYVKAFVCFKNILARRWPTAVETCCNNI